MGGAVPGKQRMGSGEALRLPNQEIAHSCPSTVLIWKALLLNGSLGALAESCNRNVIEINYPWELQQKVAMWNAPVQSPHQLAATFSRIPNSIPLLPVFCSHPTVSQHSVHTEYAQSSWSIVEFLFLTGLILNIIFMSANLAVPPSRSLPLMH